MNLPLQVSFATTLFALLNPLGVLPIFIGYTAGERRAVQRWIAFLISLTVFGLLILFLFTGSPLLKFFGISISAFRIAGGILLLLIGINLTMGDATKQAKEIVSQDQGSSLKQAQSIYRKIVIPLAMPLLVGPGVIANVILHATQAETEKQYELLVGFSIVIALISLLTFLIFQSGRWFQKVLGDVGLSILTRILGLLVASIGVQFMVTGITDIIANLITPAVLKQL
ncbi:MAG TPA: NAAT family transporter [Leptolyngbyaceae cyanobacterium M65_K2018_010]|nr:NAAT family transporter [Leptolyngbyaceae cyanobacterium M65_K2018_010]